MTAMTQNSLAVSALIIGLLALFSRVEASRTMQEEQEETTMAPAQGHRLEIDGSEIYYEVLGEGPPLLLLHGAFSTAESWQGILPLVAQGRQIVMIEQQGHGHSPDREGDLSYAGMAQDTARVLDHLKIKKAQVFGFSDGGIVGLQLAIARPDLVGSLAVLGANLKDLDSSCEKGFRKQIESIPADFAPPPLKAAYDRVAPDKSAWPALVRKIKKLALDFPGFSDDELRALKMPVLLMQGDSDSIRLEHLVAMKRLIPGAELAILPAADHFVLYMRSAEVMKIVTDFFGRHEKR